MRSILVVYFPLAYGTSSECDDLPSRVQQGLVGALGDAWNPGDGNEILEEACSPLGLELLQALRAVAVSGFEFRRCANAWRRWAEYAHESEPDRGWSPAARQALLQLQRGAAPEDVAGHHVDLEAAARLPALLLLAEHVDDDGLAMASHEMQRITHENPKALQAGEFFLRSALALLRAPCRGAMAMAAALRAAAAPRLPGLPGCGSGLQALVEEVLSEVQSREAVRAQLGDLTGPLAAFHSDAEVLGRLTSSGGAPGDEVNSAKTSFAIPAILWFVLAYETADAALHASSALGGDGQWSRAFFVGLLLGCRDGVPGAKEVQLPRFQPFAGPALQLCRKPGNCQSSSRSLDGVVADAALAEEPCQGLCYRIFMRFNASSLLQSRAERLTMPPDWDEEEDGPWIPDAGATCVARYFQFTTESGRHAPFALWPANALCKFSEESPVWHDSFQVSVPEPLVGLIGGAVLQAGRRVDVMLPSLSLDAKPEWAPLCSNVGRVKLPQGEWIETSL